MLGEDFSQDSLAGFPGNFYLLFVTIVKMQKEKDSKFSQLLLGLGSSQQEYA